MMPRPRQNAPSANAIDSFFISESPSVAMRACRVRATLRPTAASGWRLPGWRVEGGMRNERERVADGGLAESHDASVADEEQRHRSATEAVEALAGLGGIIDDEVAIADVEEIRRGS